MSAVPPGKAPRRAERAALPVWRLGPPPLSFTHQTAGEDEPGAAEEAGAAVHRPGEGSDRWGLLGKGRLAPLGFSPGRSPSRPGSRTGEKRQVAASVAGEREGILK